VVVAAADLGWATVSSKPVMWPLEDAMLKGWYDVVDAAPQSMPHLD
jgi:hypothetical protein